MSDLTQYTENELANELMSRFDHCLLCFGSGNHDVGVSRHGKGKPAILYYMAQTSLEALTEKIQTQSDEVFHERSNDDE